MCSGDCHTIWPAQHEHGGYRLVSGNARLHVFATTVFFLPQVFAKIRPFLGHCGNIRRGCEWQHTSTFREHPGYRLPRPLPARAVPEYGTRIGTSRVTRLARVVYGPLQKILIDLNSNRGAANIR